MFVVIELLRHQCKLVPIQIQFSDVPGNTFGQDLQGLVAASDHCIQACAFRGAAREWRTATLIIAIITGEVLNGDILDGDFFEEVWFLTARISGYNSFLP